MRYNSAIAALARTARLTARTVTAIKPNGTDYDVRDTDIRGFHVRVTRRGEKLYRFQYRRADGSRPVITLGRVSELTPEQARKLASDHFLAVGGGADPRKARTDWIAAPSMDDKTWQRTFPSPRNRVLAQPGARTDTK